MVNVPSELAGVIASDPEYLSGSLRFVGTRVHVQTLLDYVNGGDSLDEFLEGFPNVTREQAMAVLRWQDSQSRRGLGLNLVS